MLIWITFTVLAFGTGFAAARLADRRTLRDLSLDLEELRNRCNNAERMIGHQIGTWIVSQSRASDSRRGEGPTPSPVIREANPEEALVKRLVRVTKVKGRQRDSEMPATITGLEDHPPETGKGYHVRMNAGAVLRTSPVVRAEQEYIQTRNSSYRIEELHDYRGHSGTAEESEPYEGRGVLAAELPTDVPASSDVHATPAFGAEPEDNRARVRAIAFWVFSGWLGFALGINLLAVIGTMAVNAGGGGAMAKILEAYHPLNFAMWLEECFLFAPGFIAYWIYKRLKEPQSANS